MNKLVMHPYLYGTLALTISAMISLVSAPPHLRRSAWGAGLLSAPFALVSLDYGAYWHPARLWGLRVGLEDLLLCVSSGVLLWSLPARLEAGHFHLRIDWATIFRRYSGVTIAGALLVGICRSSGTNSVFSLLIAMVAVSSGILIRRAGYWRLALAGSGSFLVLYLAILKGTWYLFPSFSSDWNWAGLCGVNLLGVPLEEICWAAGYGAVWPLIIAYAVQAGFEPGRNNRPAVGV